MFELEMFPARDGDALVLSWGDDADHPKRMLIDAGRESGWGAIKKAYKDLPEALRTFELLVVSHIDADHIAGVVTMLRDPDRSIKFKEVWFNAYHHLIGGDWETFGPAQGEALSDLLSERTDIWNSRFGGKAVVIEVQSPLPRITIDGLELTLLSPTRPKLEGLAPEWKAWLRAEGLDRDQIPAGEEPERPTIPEGYEAFGPRPDVRTLASLPTSEDNGAPNGSSIAFAAEFAGKRVLLTADAHPTVIAKSLAALPEAERRFDLFKVSHHGSKLNLNRPIFDLIDCNRFAISTDGSRHHHPHPEAIARILQWKDGPKQFYFNYRHEEAAVWDDEALKREFSYTCEYPSDATMGRLKIPV